MKKILFVVMAVAAISFASCGNKTQQAEAATDSIAAEVTTADEEADAAVASMAANLDANDPSKFQTAFEEVKEHIAKLVKANPEAAKQYVARVQEFLKENADKIKALVGENAAVSAAIAAISDVEPDAVVSGLLDQVGNAAEDAKGAAADAVEDAKEAAADKANEVKDAAKQKTSEAVDNAADAAKKSLGL